MSELTFGIRSGALVPLELTTDFQLQPTGIFGEGVDDGHHEEEGRRGTETGTSD